MGREKGAEQARVNRWDGGFDGWRKSKGSNEEQKREWGERQRAEGWNNRGDRGPREGSEGQEDLELPGNVLYILKYCLSLAAFMDLMWKNKVVNLSWPLTKQMFMRLWTFCQTCIHAFTALFH